MFVAIETTNILSSFLYIMAIIEYNIIVILHQPNIVKNVLTLHLLISNIDPLNTYFNLTKNNHNNVFQ